MRQKKKLFILMLFMVSSLARAQARHQAEGLLVYNTAFGVLTGGIGAVINKKQGQRWYQALAKGALQGGLGGVVTYWGKRLVYPINLKQNYLYGWPAKLVHTTGASILENAAANRNAWDRWSLHLGFLRLHIRNQSPHVSLRLLPASAFSLIYAFQYGQLNLKTSLQLGTLYFRSDSAFSVPGRITATEGGNILNSMVVSENSLNYIPTWDKYAVTAHEYVHQFQQREFLVFNQYWPVDRAKKRLAKYKFFRVAEKIFYPEIDYFRLPYLLEGNRKASLPCQYFKNYFELEAQHFAVDQVIYPCR